MAESGIIGNAISGIRCVHYAGSAVLTASLRSVIIAWVRRADRPMSKLPTDHSVDQIRFRSHVPELISNGCDYW